MIDHFFIRLRRSHTRMRLVHANLVRKSLAILVLHVPPPALHTEGGVDPAVEV